MKFDAVIFDLDGVICSTDEYHYKAWKAMADGMGIPFDRTINNRLRGVSRMASLEIILEQYHGPALSPEKCGGLLLPGGMDIDPAYYGQKAEPATVYNTGLDALQLEESEFDLIKFPERGICLFKCGNERYLLQVIAPDYKSAMFGKAGGR